MVKWKDGSYTMWIKSDLSANKYLHFAGLVASLDFVIRNLFRILDAFCEKYRH